MPKKQQLLKSAIPKELQDNIASTVSVSSEGRKTQFSRECIISLVGLTIVRLMAYGFGDVANPRSDTVDLLEELVFDYIAEIVLIHPSLTLVF